MIPFNKVTLHYEYTLNDKPHGSDFILIARSLEYVIQSCYDEILWSGEPDFTVTVVEDKMLQ